MKNKFLVGAVAGMSTLALAVPLLAQFANAQSTSAVVTPPANTQTLQVRQADTQEQTDPQDSEDTHAVPGQQDVDTQQDDQQVDSRSGGHIGKDAEGDADEAHMTKSDGSPVTVKFDSNLQETNIE